MKATNKVGHDELYSLLTGKEVSWQAIIYDLIQSEQLDPWDIDLIRLTNAYLEKIKELEEASFMVSSKILLAVAMLLRIKSEFLLKKYIKSLDDILFGKPEEKIREKIYIDIEDVDLLPRTPLPRLKKVTLPELMNSLDRAMQTEHRRIKREISSRQIYRDSMFILPKFSFNIKEKIREIYLRIKGFFRNKEKENMTFTELTGNSADKKEKISTFIPLLHLENQRRVDLNQQDHFGEIYINLAGRNFFNIN